MAVVLVVQFRWCVSPCLRPRSRNMAKKKKFEIPILKVPKNAKLRQIYAAYKKQFTAADLAK